MVKESKENTFRMKGKVRESLPNMTFKVLLENGVYVLAYLSGKLRMRNIRVYPGDDVVIELTSYDLTKARIVYRER
ncbi:translation initiation factor IF-1 [Candidatus Similichlamydia epinepheli]|uniref:translation initiation factor IF-1 n=1 Tax=Candidatus Similichlamydia epinepheli TaxID=1903953 RepID=UPI000D379356|nr:translation initiation factor IF-1 [Candidatus Similichlamydia epinepheli]